MRKPSARSIAASHAPVIVGRSLCGLRGEVSHCAELEGGVTATGDGRYIFLQTSRVDDEEPLQVIKFKVRDFA